MVGESGEGVNGGSGDQWIWQLGSLDISRLSDQGIVADLCKIS